ncbi:MAG: HEAT repeat domain-containing protein [Pirellulales bacterium]
MALAIAGCLVAVGKTQDDEPDDAVEKSQASVLEKLHSSDPDVRLEGLSDLYEGREDALDHLPLVVDLAATADAETRGVALDVISTIAPSNETIPAELRVLLEYPNAGVRVTVARAILNREPGNQAAIEALPAALAASDVEQQRMAAELLEDQGFKAKSAIDSLLVACCDPAAEVRAAAAQALGAVTPARRDDVVQALRSLLSDASADVKGAAAESLWELDEPADKLVPVLLSLVEIFIPNPASGEFPSVDDHDAGIERLAKIGPEATVAIPALIRALDSPVFGERIAAADALGAMGAGAATALEPLERSLRDTQSHFVPGIHRGWIVGKHAAAAMGRIGEPARPALVRALHDKDRIVRALAVQQLGRMKADAAAVAEVVALLNDQESFVRGVAADSLGQMGPPAMPAVPQLVRLLNDEAGEQALDAIERLNPAQDQLAAALLEQIVIDRRIERPALELIRRLGPLGKKLIPAIEPLVSDPAKRRLAACALAKINPDHPGLFEILELELKSDESVDELLVRALGDMGTRAASISPTLRRLLNGHFHASYKAVWAAALVKIDPGDQVAVRSLAAALRGPGPMLLHAPEYDDATLTWRNLGPKAQAAEKDLVAGLSEQAEGKGREETATEQFACAKLLVEVGLVGPPVIQTLARICRDDLPQGVAEVIARLGPAAAPAVPGLVQMLGSEDWYCVTQAFGNAGQSIGDAEAAVKALVAIGEPAVPGLRAGLHDENRRVREGAATALGGIGAAALPAADELATALTDPAFRVRAAAATALGRLSDDRPATVSALIARLSDDHLAVRVSAARTLGNLGPKAEVAKPQLERLEHDAFAEARDAAHEGLRRIAGPGQ